MLRLHLSSRFVSCQLCLSCVGCAKPHHNAQIYRAFHFLGFMVHRSLLCTTALIANLPFHAGSTKRRLGTRSHFPLVRAGAKSRRPEGLGDFTRLQKQPCASSVGSKVQFNQLQLHQPIDWRTMRRSLLSRQVRFELGQLQRPPEYRPAWLQAHHSKLLLLWKYRRRAATLCAAVIKWLERLFVYMHGNENW